MAFSPQYERSKQALDSMFASYKEKLNAMPLSVDARKKMDLDLLNQYGTPEQDPRDIDVGGLEYSDTWKAAVKELGYGEGDYGYSMLALTLAAKNGLIDENMNSEQVHKIIERKRMAPYGFKVNKSMLKAVFS